MKHFLYLILTSIFLGSCHGDVNSEKEIISVSILPQKYLVEKIAGDRYHVNVLVPSGFSPETYEITPSQMKMLVRSRVFFITGHLTFEDLWKRKSDRNEVHFRMADISEGIELIAIEFAHDDHFHQGADPHVWVSPKTFRVMAENTYKILCEIDPDESNLFFKGYSDVLLEIGKADSMLTEIFNGLKNKSFLIFHPALGYLARDYGLEQIPVEFEGKTPPPAYMRKIVNIAAEKKIKAILIQKEFSIENASAIAREVNGDIIQIDPLDENWYDQIIYIANTLKKLDE